MKMAITASAALLALTQIAGAVAVTADELAEAHSWVQAKILGQRDPPPGLGLVFLANNDPVQPNARGGKPLRIVDREYTRGLFCHAVSKVIVTLPAPGKAFSAIVGVDSNSQTKPGRGSVVFSVAVGNREAFRSEVMREGMAGVPVQADLGGATQFALEVGDAGRWHHAVAW